jgi:RNA polymerase sigma-70 factor (ECF subfamily)
MDEGRLDDLVARSRGGDLDAFSVVVRELHGPMRGLAAMMAVRSDSIDDVLQETFIEIYRSLDRFDPERSFVKWARGVACNVIRRHGRSRGRESRLRTDAVSELARKRGEHRLAEEAPGHADSRLAALRSCLEKLPGSLRRMLDMRYGEDRTSDEIAEHTGRRSEAVRATLMRTRRRLRDCVQARLAQEGSGA